MRCALLDNMLFQFKWLLYWGTATQGREWGKQEREGEIEWGGGGVAKKKEKKARGKMVVWNIC